LAEKNGLRDHAGSISMGSDVIGPFIQRTEVSLTISEATAYGSQTGSNRPVVNEGVLISISPPGITSAVYSAITPWL
jgi:hypothetical protein